MEQIYCFSGHDWYCSNKWDTGITRDENNKRFNYYNAIKHTATEGIHCCRQCQKYESCLNRHDITPCTLDSNNCGHSCKDKSKAIRYHYFMQMGLSGNYEDLNNWDYTNYKGE